MDKKDILQGLKKLRETAQKKKFVQTIDFIVNLKGLDLKKETDKVNTFILLPHTRGKKVKIGALVGEELSTKARNVCDKVIVQDEFKKVDKKTIKKLAEEIDYFIGQADIMPQIAAAFGRILGPRGKIPNPKAGCIIPPTADPKGVVERLQRLIKAETKNELTLKMPIGTEAMKDEELIDNLHTAYNAVLAVLPQEKNNIKSVLIKLTMGKPVLLEQRKQGEGA